MKKFEYKIEVFIKETIVGSLNRQGQNGWQLVDIYDYKSTVNGYKALDVILMREIEENK